MATTVSDVKNMLVAIGYDTEEADEALIELCLDATKDNIMNQCSLSEMPTELDKVVLFRSCGQFLQVRNSTGALETALNITESVKKIVEGDTTVELSSPDGVNPIKRLSDYISWLKDYGKRDIASFRRLKW